MEADQHGHQITLTLPPGYLVVEGILLVRISVPSENPDGPNEEPMSMHPINNPRDHALIGMLTMALDKYREKAKGEWIR